MRRKNEGERTTYGTYKFPFVEISSFRNLQMVYICTYKARRLGPSPDLRKFLPSLASWAYICMYIGD